MEKQVNIGNSKLSGTPKKPFKFVLGDKIIKTKHLDDQAVTPEKLSDTVETSWFKQMYDKYIQPVINGVYRNSKSVDEKYQNITNEIYSMIASLQVGGIALSQQFGERTDIGISQKTLTKALGKFWEEMETITGKKYMDFTLSVVPETIYKEGTATITITADCSESISNFDSIRLYIDDILVDGSTNVEVFTSVQSIEKTATIKAIGVVLGKRISKTQQVTKEVPFYMGGGSVYTDILTEECRKELVGSLEGDYDVIVKNNGEYIFIIIPISRKEEFRRCKLDMNGFEIPVTTSETADFIIVQSVNTYKAGTYNVDIDINS